MTRVGLNERARGTSNIVWHRYMLTIHEYPPTNMHGGSIWTNTQHCSGSRGQAVVLRQHTTSVSPTERHSSEV